MPQLDRLSWFSQIFWLLFVLFTLYYLFVTVFLPQLVFSLKFRSKFFRLAQDLNMQSKNVRLQDLHQEYRSILKSFSKARIRVYMLTKVRKLYFLEEYSVLLNRAKFSRKLGKLFIEGYKKLRLFYLNYKRV